MRHKRAEISVQAAASSVYPDNNLLKTMVSYYSVRSGQYRQADNFEANQGRKRPRKWNKRRFVLRSARMHIPVRSKLPHDIQGGEYDTITNATLSMAIFFIANMNVELV